MLLCIAACTVFGHSYRHWELTQNWYKIESSYHNVASYQEQFLYFKDNSFYFSRLQPNLIVGP